MEAHFKLLISRGKFSGTGAEMRRKIGNLFKLYSSVKGSSLKGYCTVFQHALKSLEISASVLSERMSKTARKNTKGLKSYKEFKF